MLRKDDTVRRNHSFPAGLIVAASLLMATSAIADEARTKFEMTVIRNAAYGSEIASGNLQEAIDNISSEHHVRPADEFIAKNNLCVAYTMSAEFEKAAIECDTAIEIAKGKLRLPQSPGGADHTSNYVMALSNRGVLRAMTGEAVDARDDFEQASALRSSAATKRNLRYLESRQTQASID